MLQIKIGNSYFDIPNDIQIPISILNPLVTETAFNEIYTYSFTLQASPKNKSIYLKYVNKNEAISLSFQSHLLATGVAIMKMDSGGISIMIKNDSADFRQTIENTSFSDIELPTISICNENDDPNLKISKWKDLMDSKLPQNEPWDEGIYKFPPIYAVPALEWAVNEDQSQRDINPTMWDYGFPVNDYSIATGEYISNYGIPLITEEDGNNWRTTVSPCIRIDYFLQKIGEKFNLKIDKSFLDNIPEYKALVNYVGKVLDQREDYNGFQYNVHGTEIDLNDFKPNANLIEIFKLLNHLFGVSFIYMNSKLIIKPIKLNLKPFDISKYCMPDYTINELENKSIEYTYGLGNDFWKYGDWYGSTLKYLNYYRNKKIGNGKTDEIEIPFSVLIDNVFKASIFKWPELAKSKAYNENDFISSDKLIIGLFRGNYIVEYYSQLDPLSPPISDVGPRMVCYNQNVIAEHDLSQESFNYTKKLGTCSIYANSQYLNGEDSYLLVYSNFLNMIKTYNLEIEKNLNLPFHKIIEISKWKNPIHSIQQRNMSFQGIVKELKFTIGKNVISPTTITYLTNKNTEIGDFNIDFNDDFNS